MRDSTPQPQATRLAEAPDQGLVCEVLERVLASDQLSAAPRLQQFLRFVVEETLAGNSSQIKAYTIGVEAFGYDSDYDPQANPYVRIVAQRLRRALDRYYAAAGADDPVRFTLPLGTYVPTIAAPATESAAGRQSSTGAAGELAPRLALLRFAPVGDDPDESWLAGGLSAELLVSLGGFGHLESIGPLRWDPEGSLETPAALGRRHGARFVLSGDVQLRGDRARIAPRLVDAESGVTIWSQRYDLERGTARLFELQDEVARSVAAVVADAAGVILRRLASNDDRKRPEDTTVREAVLRWYHWNLTLSPEAHAGARDALAHAVELDASHGLAHALLSDVFFTEWLLDDSLGHDHLARAEQLARHGVNCSPNLDMAHWTLGQVHYGRRRFDSFHESFTRALQINPASAQILATYGMLLVGLQDWDRAIAATEKARSLNPHHPGWYHYAPFMNHARLGDWESARVEADQIRSGDLPLGALLRASALGHLGHMADARQEFNALLELRPRFRAAEQKMLERLMYSADNVRLVLTGVRRAGIEVGEQVA
jgi:TolB-like protein